jgi:hypothetical protein
VIANPFATRHLSRLLYQLVPAALVATVGVLMLSNLAKVADTPQVAPVETAINAEAVFRVVPREPVAEAEPDVKPAKTPAPRMAVNPKPAASTQARKAVTEPAPRQVASVPAALPIVPVTEQPPPAAAAPDGESTVMGKLRSATATVQGIPQWAARSVAGWFADVEPPRPPAAVPEPAQDFQAAM